MHEDIYKIRKTKYFNRTLLHFRVTTTTIRQSFRTHKEDYCLKALTMVNMFK